ncbi:hypothetical protein ACUN9Y_09670 [Halomonas sp. V046]|uniref:hypothetical protein n=1 Tax=Halomonas sp. V046 TaxID=3459611 RepID=UPI00404460B7
MAKRGWSKSLSGFSRQVESDQNKRLRATALQALTGVIERSPVDTGAFRGNNIVSVGQPQNTYNLEATGDYNLQQGEVRLSRVTGAFEVIYIQNNLPYSEELEGGSSTQAPAGVYAITFDNLRAQNT